MNLLRGTGIRGLCGMRPIANNPLHPDGIKVIRPLLCTTRDYIEYYLKSKRHLEWVTDSTNADTAIARNAIRAEFDGTIVAILFNSGDPVEEDDVIIKIAKG